MVTPYFDATRQRWRVRWGRRGARMQRFFPSLIEAETFARALPETPRGPYRTSARTTDAEWIARSVQIDDSGCWRWQLARMPREGYGLGTRRGRRVLAHRISYETFVGPIPEGMQLDHLCRVRHCVNPEHLEPVTPRENIMRSPITQAALNAAKRECPQGHPYDEVNTYRYRGARICRACSRARRAAWRASRVERQAVAS
jgi:hypothetical protein